MRGTFEPLGDAGLTMAFDMFWERFEGYLFAQYFSQCLAGDFTIAVSSLEGPVFRWKAVEMCQGLRFDHADASFGAGEECHDTIGHVQHLWLTELAQTHEHSKEAGFFKWATGMDPPENADPFSSCPFHDLYPGALPQHRAPSLGRDSNHWVLRSRLRGEDFTIDTAQEVPDPRDPWPNQYSRELA